MCEALYVLFEEHSQDLQDILDDGQRFRVSDVGCCEVPITYAVMIKVLGKFSGQNTLGIYGFSYTYYSGMSDLFGNLLARVLPVLIKKDSDTMKVIG